MQETGYRKHITFIVGSNDVSAADIHIVATNIARITGGLTITPCQGLWAANGAEHTNSYQDIETETAWKIEVAVDDNADDFQYTLQSLKNCFYVLAGKATWIHCEVSVTQAHHFAI